MGMGMGMGMGKKLIGSKVGKSSPNSNRAQVRSRPVEKLHAAAASACFEPLEGRTLMSTVTGGGSVGPITVSLQSDGVLSIAGTSSGPQFEDISLGLSSGTDDATGRPTLEVGYNIRRLDNAATTTGGFAFDLEQITGIGIDVEAPGLSTNLVDPAGRFLGKVRHVNAAWTAWGSGRPGSLTVWAHADMTAADNRFTVAGHSFGIAGMWNVEMRANGSGQGHTLDASGYGGRSVISATGHDDVIRAAQGESYLNPGGGNDTVEGGRGHDYLNAGYWSDGDVTVTDGALVSERTNSTLLGIDEVRIGNYYGGDIDASGFTRTAELIGVSGDSHTVTGSTAGGTLRGGGGGSTEAVIPGTGGNDTFAFSEDGKSVTRSDMTGNVTATYVLDDIQQLRLSGRGGVDTVLGSPAAGTRLSGLRTGVNFVVSSTADNPNGPSPDAGVATLRDAINYANAHPATDPTTIGFDLKTSDPGYDATAGVFNIRPAAVLPALAASNVTIDGYSQPGARANTSVTADNAALKVRLLSNKSGDGGGLDYGIKVTGHDDTVQGLIINRFTVGVVLEGKTAHDNRIQGNFVGINAAGTGDATKADGNGQTMLITAGASNNVIGVEPDAANARPAQRNILSGGYREGVILRESGQDMTTGNVIAGNLIGTNRWATGPLGNGSISQSGAGVRIEGASGNTIGGDTDKNPLARNIIAGNGGGISIYPLPGAPASGNLILGNYFGVDPSATIGVPNGYNNLAIFAPGNVIGGATAKAGEGAGNLIGGGPREGISLDPGADRTTIQGNLFRLGSPALNIYSNDNLIGGAAAGTGNAFAAAGRNVYVKSGQRNAVLGNSMYSGSAGITLDAGANNNQPAPAVASASSAGSGTAVQFTLAGVAAGQTYRVEFFSGSRPADSRELLGSIDVTASDANTSSGVLRAAEMLPGSAAPGLLVTATATDAAGNTSAFSAARTVASQAPAVLSLSDASGAYGGTITFTASLASAGMAVGNQRVTFEVNGRSVGSATTDGQGVATLSGASLAGLNAGSYSLTAGFAGDANYTATSAAKTLEVRRAAPTVMATGGTFTYDGTDRTGGGSVTGVVPTDTFPSPSLAYYNASDLSLADPLPAPPTDAGSYLVVAEYTGDPNYTPASSDPATIVIEKAALGVTAADACRVYGHPNPALTGTVTGLVESDDVAVDYATAAAAASPVGAYDILPVLSDPAGRLKNYEVAVTKGTLRVNATTLSAAAQPVSGSEGSSAGGVVVSFTTNNPIAAAIDFAATITWGDGRQSAGTVEPDGRGGFVVLGTHTYADGGSYAVTVTVADNAGGGTAAASGSAAIANVPPAVDLTGPAAGSVFAAGTAVTLTGSFADPNMADDHGAMFTLTRAGAAPVTVAATVGAGGAVQTVVNGGDAPLAPGVYHLGLTVTDKDGGAGSATTAAGQDAYFVVYDPSAGYVTGGGWIDSPAGAYAADPAAAGRATFGFVSQYKRGATVPGGNTEFQFKTGGLSFSSTGYDWLVVSGGGKAKYKGSGTINGRGGYGFMLTAVDGGRGGGPDTFRIKIWDSVSGMVVYDNQMGRPDDDADAGTALGGGSIVIHTR